MGAERAGAGLELAGGRACAAAGAPLRGADPVSPVPVVSCGGAGAGSAVMMLTGGIEDADGK